MFGQLHFSDWITRVSIFNGPRVCLRLMVVFNPNSVCLGSCIFLLDHKGKYFSMARGCSRLMVVFNPNSVCLGSCILSSQIIMESNFISPRMCPWLLVALTQTPFVWAVRHILLDHEDKLFCRWLLNMLIYQVSIFGWCSLQPNKFVGGQFICALQLIPKIAGYVCKCISPKFVFGYTILVSLV